MCYSREQTSPDILWGVYRFQFHYQYLQRNPGPTCLFQEKKRSFNCTQVTLIWKKLIKLRPLASVSDPGSFQIRDTDPDIIRIQALMNLDQYQENENKFTVYIF